MTERLSSSLQSFDQLPEVLSNFDSVSTLVVFDVDNCLRPLWGTRRLGGIPQASISTLSQLQKFGFSLLAITDNYYQQSGQGHQISRSIHRLTGQPSFPASLEGMGLSIRGGGWLFPVQSFKKSQRIIEDINRCVVNQINTVVFVGDTIKDSNLTDRFHQFRPDLIVSHIHLPSCTEKILSIIGLCTSPKTRF